MMRDENLRSAGAVAGLAIVLLFFFQLIADFIESVYVFGLLNTDIPIEILSVLLLFSPLLLVIGPRLFSRTVLLFCGELMILSRLIEPLLDGRGRMWVAGLGVSFFLIFFPGYLHYQGKRKDLTTWQQAGIGLVLAAALSITFRSVYFSLDASTVSWGQIIGWGMGIFAALAIPRYLMPASEDSKDNQESGTERSASVYKIIALSLGIGAVFTILYFSFSAPTVISRWTGADYSFIVISIMVVLTLFGTMMLWKPEWITGIQKPVLLAINLIFVGSMVLTIWLHQVDFPASPGAFPIEEKAAGPLHWIALIVMLLSMPVIPLDFGLIVGEMVSSQPSIRQIGTGFAISSFFLMVIILAHAFTTTYDYIPIIGPVFRDRFWLVYLAAGLVMLLSLFAAGDIAERVKWTRLTVDRELLPEALIALTLITSAAVLAMGSDPEEAAGGESIRVLTYNIQQGYDQNGTRNYNGQLKLIEELEPDIIGLQESDTARIANGNGDVVRYLADNLDMYSYYGPKSVNGTFGIALLSRFPIENPRTSYLFSEGEQVAVIEAEINTGSETVNVMVTHLGNGGPMIQNEQFLAMLADKSDVVAMGDFNYRKDSEQYKLATTMLEDTWWLQWADGVDDTGTYPEDKIDHIFISPDIKVSEARIIDDPASDHPAVLAEVLLKDEAG